MKVKASMYITCMYYKAEIFDKNCLLFQWNQIDEATGLTGMHSDLSALTKEHTQVFTLSIWDIQRKFRSVGNDVIVMSY